MPTISPTNWETHTLAGDWTQAIAGLQPVRPSSALQLRKRISPLSHQDRPTPAVTRWNLWLTPSHQFHLVMQRGLPLLNEKPTNGPLNKLNASGCPACKPAGPTIHESWPIFTCKMICPCSISSHLMSVSVCLSEVEDLSKWLDGSSWIVAWRLH